jgi:hypothetical protein
MTDTDEVTFAVVRQRLAEARDALDDLAPRPAVTTVIGRARRRRAGRRLAAAGASLAAASLAITVAYFSQNHQPPGQTRLPVQASGPAHAHGPVHGHLAASWSVDTNADGTVTFGMRDTSDPARLQRALRQAGVPAQVHFGEICLVRGRHGLSTKGILTGPGGHTGPKLQSVTTADGGGSKVMGIIWTVNPARIPPGAHFVISAVPASKVTAGHIQATWELVPASAPVSCTSTPPKLPV